MQEDLSVNVGAERWWRHPTNSNPHPPNTPPPHTHPTRPHTPALQSGRFCPTSQPDWSAYRDLSFGHGGSLQQQL